MKSARNNGALFIYNDELHRNSVFLSTFHQCEYLIIFVIKSKVS